MLDEPGSLRHVRMALVGVEFMAVFAKKKPGSLRLVINRLVESVNDDAKRLRELEQRSGALDSRLNSVEQSIMGNYRELADAAKALDGRISELDGRIREMESRISEMIRQFKRVATKSEMKALENLIEIYNPIRSSFVTREEFETLRKRKGV